MLPSFNTLKIHNVSLSYEDWYVLLRTPIPERPNFLHENETIQIGRVLAQFLGIPLDEDEYYNGLFDYVDGSNNNVKLLSEESLDKTINNQHFQSIQKVLNIHQEQKLSINRFVAFLDGEKLIVKSEIPALHRKIREALVSTLELFSTKEPDGLKSTELRRILVDIVKWSLNHLSPAMEKANPETEMPKFLWYGQFKKSHQYFLYFLAETGCDLAVFDPEGNDIFTGFLGGDHFVHHYQNKKTQEPFPKEKRNRKTTVAYQASREIESILNHEGSGLYKPWQLREYTPSSLTLRTTYDEFFILSKEIAMVRPDFEVKDGKVKIPSVFVKVQGVSRNKKEYWDRLHTLSSFDNSLLIRQFPFTTTTSNDFRFHYRNALGRDGLLSTEKMMEANYWKYSYLPIGLQKGIAHAIRGICEKPELKALAKESPEELRIYLFSQSMQTPRAVIQLLEKFDYSQSVPKLILFNNELTGLFTRSDAALLLLLNHFGVDLAVYNPTGHNDIENYISESLFDTHWLEEVVFDQEFKEPSIMKKGIFQGFLKNLRGD